MMFTRRSSLSLLMMAAASVLLGQTTPASGITGKWHFVLDTEGGPREYDAEFKLQGTAVTGTWDTKNEVKGTFADGKLNLEFPVKGTEVGDGTLKIVGTLSDGLAGSWSFDAYSGQFKATRPKS